MPSSNAAMPSRAAASTGSSAPWPAPSTGLSTGTVEAAVSGLQQFAPQPPTLAGIGEVHDAAQVKANVVDRPARLDIGALYPDRRAAGQHGIEIGHEDPAIAGLADFREGAGTVAPLLAADPAE